jgi:hypothetical protein
MPQLLRIDRNSPLLLNYNPLVILCQYLPCSGLHRSMVGLPGRTQPLKKDSLNRSEFGNYSEASVIHSTSLFASFSGGNSAKLTAVGYVKKPVSCSNAKHRLFFVFSCNLATLSLRPASGRRVGDEGLSGGQAETNTLRVSGLCHDISGLTLATGVTTLGNSLSDSLGILFFSCSGSLSGPQRANFATG